MSGDQRPRWTWYFAWVTVGVLLGFGMTSLGLFTLPAALVLGIYLFSRGGGRDALGCVAGTAATVAVFAAMSLDHQPCSATPQRTVLAPGEVSSSYSCGGMNGDVMLAPTLLILAAAVGTHIWRRQRAAS